jgi:hypothetical protein
MRRFFSWQTRMIQFDPQWHASLAVAEFVSELLSGAPMKETDPDVLAAAQEQFGVEGEVGAEQMADIRKNTKDNHDLCRTILSDHELQLQARMLTSTFGPTFESYANDIKRQQTQWGCAHLEAENACGDWFQEIEKIVRLSCDEKVLARFDITPSAKVLPRDTRPEVMWRSVGREPC